MEFTKWCEAAGFDLSVATDRQKTAYQAAWRAETNPAPAPKAGAEKPESESFDAKMKAIEAEDARVSYIREASLAAMEKHIGNTAKIEQIKSASIAAEKDGKVQPRDFDYAMLKIDRSLGHPVSRDNGNSAVDADVIEAAICMSHRLKGHEQKFNERTLESAHKTFPRGIGLIELMSMAAERNSNYRGSRSDHSALCRAAMSPQYDRSAVGPSTINVTGILSNIANKFLAAGFLYGEQSWREVSKIQTARDFKTMTTYRLTGSNKFEKVAPGGEIRHGTLGELSYTNRVDTYGKLLGIDRRDLRNDDLGALTGMSDELGRGAIDSLNEVWYTTYLDDAAFYPTDKSLLNYDDGATDSVLSLAGLQNADSIFAAQTKPDGTPLGAQPAILFVPRALFATAKNLMNGSITEGAASTAVLTVKNVWEGMFRVVPSLYLQSSAITGYSATAWYLLADPNDIATIAVAFLDGIESPTVETSQFDFDRLGIAMRAYLDFGIAKQEYRGGVKLKGAA